MNCVEFGFDRSRGFGSGRGQFWSIAIDRPTRPYNIASTTVQQVMLPVVEQSCGTTVPQLDQFSAAPETDGVFKCFFLNSVTCHLNAYLRECVAVRAPFTNV
jgi:hypothetical protein